MKKALSAFVLLLIFTMSLTGCRTQTRQTISVDGSTSMEKVIGALGEAFALENTDARFTYNPTGSSSGIAAVSEGRCDIGLSSRALTEGEVASGLSATPLAYDAIAIIVHKDNPVDNISRADLAKLYTQKTSNWRTFGGTDAEIVRIGREAGSGTRAGFESSTGTENQCCYRQELTSSGDVIATVSQNVNAIGYTSLAALKDTVKVLAIDHVVPSEYTVINGDYPVQRPFLLITKANTLLSPTAQAFFDYAISFRASQIISRTGVIPAHTEK